MRRATRFPREFTINFQHEGGGGRGADERRRTERISRYRETFGKAEVICTFHWGSTTYER